MYYFIPWLLCLFAVQLVLGQGRQDLQAKRTSLNQQIQETNRLLEQTSKTRQSTVSDLSRLRKKASAQADTLKLIEQEVSALAEDLAHREAYLGALRKESELVKKHYRHLLLRRYQYRRSAAYLAAHRAGFGRRYSYLRHFEVKRGRQLLLFSQTLQALGDLTRNLEQFYQLKRADLERGAKTQAEIDAEISDKNKRAETLAQQEKRLKTELAERQKQKNQLNNKIESVIRQELAGERAEERKYPQAPAFAGQGTASKTGADFKKQKGRLAYPVQGKVVAKYGKHPHPDYPLVVVENNGIDIQTKGSVGVKAVYEGLVVSVFAIPGLQNAVMLKHGNYYTTYSNLETVGVKRGQVLKTGQVLGQVGRDASRNAHVLHFEIWQGKQKENPSLWLR